MPYFPPLGNGSNQSESLFHFTQIVISVHLPMSIQCSCAVLLHTQCMHGTYSSIVLDIVYTKEKDVLIDTNLEAISFHSIYNHVAFLKEPQCS